MSYTSSRYSEDFLTRPGRAGSKTGSRTGSNRSSRSGSPYGSRRGSRDNLLDHHRDSSPDSDYGSASDRPYKSRKTSYNYRDGRSFSVVLDELEFQLRKVEDESSTLTHDFNVIRNQHQNQTRRIQDLQNSFEEARYTLDRISRRTYGGDIGGYDHDSPDKSEKSDRSDSFKSSDRGGSFRSYERSDRSDSFKSSDYSPKAERTQIRVVVKHDA